MCRAIACLLSNLKGHTEHSKFLMLRWTASVCFFRYAKVLKFLLHKSQWCFLIFWWTFSVWILINERLANFKWHISQLNFLIWRWTTLLWSLKALRVWKSLLQASQRYLLCFSWTDVTWVFRSELAPKLLGQIWQENFSTSGEHNLCVLLKLTIGWMFSYIYWLA